MAFNELQHRPAKRRSTGSESLVKERGGERRTRRSESLSEKQVKKLIKELEQEMMDAVKKLEFEKAASS